MHRKVLIDWFLSPKGRILQRQEAKFLEHAMAVSCKQVIVQIGALGWENDFIESEFYQSFVVLDDEQRPQNQHCLIKAESDFLPIKEASVDLIILPHLLEFETDKHQVLREVERILKPEGKLIILSFNPWNIYINLQYMRHRVPETPWLPSLMTRTRIQDWLRLLNFEVEVAAGFNFDDSKRTAFDSERRKHELNIAAYAIKAIKRNYHYIPIEAAKNYQSDFAMARLMDSDTATSIITKKIK